MLKLFVKTIIFSVLFLGISSTSYSKDPLQFIKEVTGDASSILKNEISKEQKIKKLKDLAEESVDIKGVGLYSLGKYRKLISKEKLNEYEVLFKKYFLKSFSSRLSEYSDPKINVISQEIINENYTIVSSILVADEKRPEIKIDWRVYTKYKDKPMIRDLIIEGLSLARTQKEEFNSVIKSADGDINILFNNLREFAN
tara:strand:+ start:62 stop:655 length:594 start_codon:yes stop_codon:yes gene_type:complete